MSTSRSWRRRAARRRVLVVGGAATAAEWRRHHYAAAILEAAERAPEGQVSHVDIYHDDGCACWRGGACDCDPIVHLRGDPRDN